MLAEKEIQNAFIDALKKQGYTHIGSHLKVEDIEPHFKKEVERLNKSLLPAGLNDVEFQRLLNNLNKDMSTIYGLLRYGVELVLDNNEMVTIKLFDTHDYSNNTFQVTDELVVKGLRDRRLDVIILMNGLPVVASELKKVNGSRGVVEAIDDINVYAKEGIYRVGLLKFVQIYVASNNVATKYFATSIASQSGEQYGTGFHWADENNNRIKKLIHPDSELSFTDTFLKPEILCDVLWTYMLNIPSPRDEIRVLRPYQVHAVKSGTERLLNTDENGFFWHATGSGKTLTSYMLTKAVSEAPKFNKTIMLLDRNDLADQTIEEYGLFGNKEVAVVKGTNLLKALNDDTVKTVVTTIQSFSRMLDKRSKSLRKYSDLPVCFIIDECHRTTFGAMFKQIKDFYKKAQFIGFTGTPRLAENPNVHDRITKDIFGEPIHIYTIKNAIDDGNVLSFELNEVNINSTTVDALVNKDKNYYNNPARRNQIAEYVAENFWKHTAQKFENKEVDYAGGYTAMFAADGIPSAYAYWQLMTPLLAKQNRKSAIVFSVQNKENDVVGDGTARDWFEKIIVNYDQTFGTNFGALLLDGDFEEVRKNYLRDVTKRIKRKEIDLIIVSDMLLTGFDAPTLNTIYLDKNLRYHDLLQAMSRTNRLHIPTGKKVGNVVIFSDREMTDDVNDSILLYSNGDNVEGIVERRSYQELYTKVVEQITALKNVYPTPESIDSIEEISQLVQLARLYSSLNSNLQRIQMYDEWEKKDWKKLSTTEDEIQEYYASIVDKKTNLGLNQKHLDDEEWAQLEFEITKISVITIDVAYINYLLRNGIYAPEKDKKKWFDQVKKAVKSSTDPEVKKSEEAILMVTDSYKNIHNEQDFWAKLDATKQAITDVKYVTYSKTFNIEEPVMRTLVNLYQKTDSYPENRIDDILNSKGLSIKQKKLIRNEIEKAIHEIAQ